jgi:hypothetical protein
VPENEEEKREAIFHVIEALLTDEGDVIDEYDTDISQQNVSQQNTSEQNISEQTVSAPTKDVPPHVDKKPKVDEIEEI